MIFRKFLNLYHERQARKRLAEIVAQTRNSYETQRSQEGRKAALKNKPPRLKRIPYGWREKAR